MATSTSAAHIQSLPVDVLLAVAAALPAVRDVYSLIATSKSLCSVLHNAWTFKSRLMARNWSISLIALIEEAYSTHIASTADPGAMSTKEWARIDHACEGLEASYHKAYAKRSSTDLKAEKPHQALLAWAGLTACRWTSALAYHSASDRDGYKYSIPKLFDDCLLSFVILTTNSAHQRLVYIFKEASDGHDSLAVQPAKSRTSPGSLEIALSFEDAAQALAMRAFERHDQDFCDLISSYVPFSLGVGNKVNVPDDSWKANTIAHETMRTAPQVPPMPSRLANNFNSRFRGIFGSLTIVATSAEAEIQLSLAFASVTLLTMSFMTNITSGNYLSDVPSLANSIAFEPQTAGDKDRLPPIWYLRSEALARNLDPPGFGHSRGGPRRWLRDLISVEAFRRRSTWAGFYIQGGPRRWQTVATPSIQIRAYTHSEITPLLTSGSTGDQNFGPNDPIRGPYQTAVTETTNRGEHDIIVLDLSGFDSVGTWRCVGVASRMTGRVRMRKIYIDQHFEWAWAGLATPWGIAGKWFRCDNWERWWNKGDIECMAQSNWSGWFWIYPLDVVQGDA